MSAVEPGRGRPNYILLAMISTTICMSSSTHTARLGSSSATPISGQARAVDHKRHLLFRHSTSFSTVHHLLALSLYLYSTLSTWSTSPRTLLSLRTKRPRTPERMIPPKMLPRLVSCSVGYLLSDPNSPSPCRMLFILPPLSSGGRNARRRVIM